MIAYGSLEPSVDFVSRYVYVLSGSGLCRSLASRYRILRAELWAILAKSVVVLSVLSTLGNVASIARTEDRGYLDDMRAVIADQNKDLPKKLSASTEATRISMSGKTVTVEFRQLGETVPNTQPFIRGRFLANVCGNQEFWGKLLQDGGAVRQEHSHKGKVVWVFQVTKADCDDDWVEVTAEEAQKTHGPDCTRQCTQGTREGSWQVR